MAQRSTRTDGMRKETFSSVKPIEVLDHESRMERERLRESEAVTGLKSPNE